MYGIRDLVGKVKDVNRGDRYEVTLYLPEGLKSSYNFSVDDITFYCQKCNMPGFAHSQIDSRVYGQKKKLGSFRTSDTTVSTSYLFDYKGINIGFFEAWSALIMDPVSKRLGYYEDYIGSMEICIFNNLNERLVTAELSEVYPVKLSDLLLAYDNSEILPLEIEWQYRERKIIQESSRSKGGSIIVDPIGVP